MSHVMPHPTASAADTVGVGMAAPPGAAAACGAAGATSAPAAAPKGALVAQRMFVRQWIVAFVTVVFPAVSFVFGLAWIATHSVPLFYLGLWAVMHYVGMAGISVGYHRLASHQSFKGKPWVRRMLAIWGSMSAQGPVLYWASNHRRHHHMCDKAGDVHSPYFSEAGERWSNPVLGLWQAHTGWMFRSHPTNPIRYSLDLIKDKDIVFANRHYYKWVALGVVVPGLVAFAVYGTLESLGLGLLIGGGMRLFTVQHVTWAINSLTHYFGRKPYANHDHSTNLFWLSLPTAGEAWHNNHHAFPYSARLGLEWWQLDSGWWLLVTLRQLGLVWDLKLPTAEMKAAKRITAPAAPASAS
jgi:stearoyl-CoA desaturase (delta-9 desaturase)